MIVSRIQGGLGNQFFIYASGYAISQKTNSKFVLDINSGYRNDMYGREYLLKYYQIDDRSLSPILSSDTFGLDYLRSGVVKTHRILPKSLVFYLTDAKLEENGIPKTQLMYMDGYFQDYRLFDEFKPFIKKCFSLKEKLPAPIEEYNQQIKNSKSVCIHFRSYDEVPDGHRSENMSLQETYYVKAVEYFNKTMDNPTFFVFSDKIEKAKKLFSSINNQMKYVELTASMEKGMLYDLELMKSCKNFVIANSTFSWWGAYLSESENKKVIRPSGSYYQVNDRLFKDDWKTL